MDDLARDLRYALRRLRREPGFAASAVLTLGLAIGASAGVFSAVEGVLLRPLPYEDPSRLVLLWQRTVDGGADRFRVPAPDVVEYRASSRTLGGVAFTNGAFDAVLGGGDRPEHLRVGLVTPDFFDVLGVRPHLGRTFRPGEAVLPPSAFEDTSFIAPPSVVVLGHELWRGRFGGDSAVLGRTIRLNGTPFEVVGVAPRAFELALPPDVGLTSEIDAWTPLRIPLGLFERDEGEWQDQDSDNTGAVIARLAAGATLARARAEMDAVAARQRQAVPFYRNAGMRIEVVSLQRDAVAHVRPALLLLLAAVLFVLLVASLNVGGLLLARGVARRGELSLRTALGADRGRLLRQLLTESVLVAGLAAGVGLLLAAWGIGGLGALAPRGIPRLDAVALNGAVLAFALGMTALSAVASGFLPALIATRSIHGALRSRAGAGLAGGRERLRRGLMASQVALSLVLLIGTGLLLGSFVRLQQIRPGFEPAGLLTLRMTLPGGTIGGPGERARFIRRFADRLRELPGVEAVGVVGGLPLGGEVWIQPFGLEGSQVDEWSRNEANFRVVDSGYFRAMGTRLLAGRTFTEREDLVEEERVAIVDAALARRIVRGGDPEAAVGKQIGFPLDGDPTWAEVVGVVESVRYQSLERPARATIYVPYRQEASRTLGLALRTAGDASRLEATIRRELEAMEAGVPIPLFEVRPMERYMAEATAPERFALWLVAAFGVITLVLAAVGLYGGVAYSVRQRRHEIGVRVAIGATPSDVLREFARRGLTAVGVGVAAGSLLAAAVSRSLTGLLVEIEPIHVPTYAAAAALVLVVGTIASIVPARGAARVNPVEALRRE